MLASLALPPDELSEMRLITLGMITHDLQTRSSVGRPMWTE